MTTTPDPRGGAGPADTVFHAGRMVPADQAALRVDSMALRYGLSVFEGVRLYRRADGGLRPWLLAQHVERLRSSMDAMRLPDPGVDRIADIVGELTERNGLTDDAYCRISVSADGPGLIDAPVRSALTVTVRPMGRKRWLAGAEGMRLHVSRWQRPSADVLPTHAKSISQYAGSRVALMEAKAAGYDGCLLTTPEGHVAEAPTATLCAVHDGVLATPPLSDGVLPGVTRAWVLAVCRTLGIPAAPSVIDAKRLGDADEVFLCGTGLEFATVRAVDAAALPAWPASPVTDRIVDRYFAEVRGDAPATDVSWSPVD
ncbi:aminotransferase class IV [Streptomyces sp. SS]|uniref:aminotransferase class IV n=1 Tax=Streptomyces sp. SS TaxID=260742 RepID=UPI000362F906|nr:aminotransferase class IV [Streptomyces sp. SS]